MSPKSMLILGVPLAAFFAFCVYMAVDSTHYLKPFDPRENNRAEYDPETADAVLAMVKGARLVNVEGDSQPTLGAYLEQLGQVPLVCGAVLGLDAFEQLRLIGEPIAVREDAVEAEAFVFLGRVADQALDVRVVDAEDLVGPGVGRPCHHVQQPTHGADALAVDLGRLPVADDHQAVASHRVERLGAPAR